MGDQGPDSGVGHNNPRRSNTTAASDTQSAFLDQIKHEQDDRLSTQPAGYFGPERRTGWGWGRRVERTIIILASLLCIIVISHAYLRYVIFPPTLPYEYTVIDKAPDPPVLCPGAELIYTAKIMITRVPLVINLYRTIYSLDFDQTYVFGGDPVVAIHDHVHTIVRTYALVVPNLPPGKYELKEAAQDNSTRATVFTVPFSVPAGCPDRSDLPLQLQQPTIRTKDQPAP